MHTVLDASYSEHALIIAITHSDLRPNLVGYENKGIPLELLMLIRQCWNKDPSVRPDAGTLYSSLLTIASKLKVDTSTGVRQSYASPSKDSLMEIVPEETAITESADVAMEELHQANDVAPVAFNMSNIENPGSDGLNMRFNVYLKCGSFAVSLSLEMIRSYC